LQVSPLGASEERVHQIVVREAVERTTFELLAANEIRLVGIDAERVTNRVDPRRRERKQVSTPREDSASGDDQISHLTRFCIDHDAVQLSEIAVLIVPDRDVLAGEKRAEDKFRFEITEAGVSDRIGAHALRTQQQECRSALNTVPTHSRQIASNQLNVGGLATLSGDRNAL